MDKFIVKKALNGKGAYYYFKNGLFHREAGPAIIDFDDRHLFDNLLDQDLYEEEIIQKALPENFEESMLSVKQNRMMDLLFVNYYLNGHPYTKEEFERTIRIKNEIKAITDDLTVGLPNNKIADKKKKVKV